MKIVLASRNRHKIAELEAEKMNAYLAVARGSAEEPKMAVIEYTPKGAEGRDPQANWRVGSILAHVVLPILYIADWFLFYERKQCKWYYPIASIGFPLAYVIFLLIQAIILKFDSSILIPTTTTPLIYPYFFVNIETQGLPKVLMWVAILSVAFVAVGYLFYGLDRLSKKNK